MERIPDPLIYPKRRGRIAQQSQEHRRYGNADRPVDNVQEILSVLEMPNLMRQNGKQLPLIIFIHEIVRDAKFAMPQQFQEKCVFLR